MYEKIKKLEYQIMDEVSGAEEYFNCANKWKKDNPEMSKNYMEMANQELGHAKELHKMLLSLKTNEDAKDDYLIDFLADVNEDQILRVSKKE